MTVLKAVDSGANLKPGLYKIVIPLLAFEAAVKFYGQTDSAWNLFIANVMERSLFGRKFVIRFPRTNYINPATGLDATPKSSNYLQRKGWTPNVGPALLGNQFGEFWCLIAVVSASNAKVSDLYTDVLHGLPGLGIGALHAVNNPQAPVRFYRYEVTPAVVKPPVPVAPKPVPVVQPVLPKPAPTVIAPKPSTPKPALPAPTQTVITPKPITTAPKPVTITPPKPTVTIGGSTAATGSKPTAAASSTNHTTTAAIGASVAALALLVLGVGR